MATIDRCRSAGASSEATRRWRVDIAPDTRRSCHSESGWKRAAVRERSLRLTQPAPGRALIMGRIFPPAFRRRSMIQLSGCRAARLATLSYSWLAKALTFAWSKALILGILK